MYMPASLAFLSLYVAFERIQGNTSNRCTKVGVCPQTWKLAFELWELLPQGSATGSLDVLHKPMYPKLRVTSNQHMHMIGHHFHLNELLSPLLNSFEDDSFQAFIYG